MVISPRNQMRSYMNRYCNTTCHSYRLNDQALSVRVGGEKGMHIGKCQIYRLDPQKMTVDQLILTDNEATGVTRPILKEIRIAWPS